MQEQPTHTRQGTEFQSGDQIHLHESNLPRYDARLEAMRQLIDETYADLIAEEAGTTLPEAEVPASPEVIASEERAKRIGTILAAMRAGVKSDLDLTA